MRTDKAKFLATAKEWTKLYGDTSFDMPGIFSQACFVRYAT